MHLKHITPIPTHKLSTPEAYERIEYLRKRRVTPKIRASTVSVEKLREKFIKTVKKINPNLTNLQILKFLEDKKDDS
tara:strand:+ start:476 stop:706 length:231 start_codon:yes stop_codon:yes gene_type:complete